MANTDSFGQSEPTFKEDPLANPPVFRDEPNGRTSGETIAPRNPSNLFDKIQDQFRLAGKEIQFIGEPYNPPGGDLAIDIPVEITDADGVRITFANPASIQVDITGGSASNKKLSSADGTISGAVDASIILALVDGQVLCRVEATTTGTVDLGLTDVAGTGLRVADTATITFS